MEGIHLYHAHEFFSSFSHAPICVAIKHNIGVPDLGIPHRSHVFHLWGRLQSSILLRIRLYQGTVEKSNTFLWLWHMATPA